MRVLYTITALALVLLVIGLSINLGRERARLELLKDTKGCNEIVLLDNGGIICEVFLTEYDPNIIIITDKAI